MMRVMLFLLLVEALSNPLAAQILISGKVFSAQDQQPIAYANIGIVKTDVGTISNEDGSFSIKIPRQYAKERLLMSALGYERIHLSIDSVKSFNNITVYFHETASQLNTVTITGKRFGGKYEFGNEIFEGGSIYADTVTAGSAMALLIENTTYPKFEFPAYIERASLRIAKNTFRNFKVRIRVYSVDSVTGLPGKDLLHKSIVKNSYLKQGWLKIDLAEHNIVVNGPFYLAFEWILDKRDRAYLHQQYVGWRQRHPELVSVDHSVVEGNEISYMNYNGSFWAGTSFGIAVSSETLKQFKCYYRFSSFGEWIRGGSILTARVTLSN